MPRRDGHDIPIGGTRNILCEFNNAYAGNNITVRIGCVRNVL